MDTFKQRLKRYTDEPAQETFGWMTMLIQSHHLPELRRARENRLYQCLYLMTHAIAHTVSETMFGYRGLTATRFFLESFVDGDPEDRKFSRIASELHDVRNVVAHEAYSSLQHSVEYFRDDIEDGWRREGNTLLINPARYGTQVEDVFLHFALSQAIAQLPREQALKAKYNFIAKWLRLSKTDSLKQTIKALNNLTATDDLDSQDIAIRAAIYQQYGL